MRWILLVRVALLCLLAAAAGELRAAEEPATPGEADPAAAASPAPTPSPSPVPTEPGDKRPVLKISGELKQRGEVRRDHDFGTGEVGDPAFVGQLIRLKFAGEVAGVGYTVELTDGREFGAERKSATAQSIGLVQGYLEYGERVRLRLGRQEITLGQKRLIGSSGWAYRELAAYDGIRLQSTLGRNAIDAFAVTVAEGEMSVRDDSSLAGLSYTWNGGRLQPGVYVLFHHEDSLEGWSGSTDMPIGGINGSVQVVSGLVLDYELIFQGGRRRGVEHRASLYHAGVKYTEPAKKRYWIAVEYNVASGDGDPTDDVSNTFDKLYSINHGSYGYIDYQDPRNMRNLRVTVGGKLAPRLTAQVDYHNFRLDQARDGWYSRQAGVSLEDPTGEAGTDVGSEIDVTAKVDVLRSLALEAGYCRFFSGAFVETLLGGSSPQPDFGYLQLRFKF